MLRLISICIFLTVASYTLAEVKLYQLHINRGALTTVKQTSFPALALNDTGVYSSQNKVILVSPTDTLFLQVWNNDTAIHRFVIQGIGEFEIAPGSLFELKRVIPQGIHLYYDTLNYPKNTYLGLGGMIVSTVSTHKTFYWNIKEHSAAWSDSIARGGTVNWNDYEPDYFTINGKSYPDIQGDTAAKVTANVGDTVLICIANTGQSMHSIHFHGFHIKCLYSTDPTIVVGWDKDTWALHRMTGGIFQLIVDKPGFYSVHDHNLVAVSGGGTHPNGMFLIMEMK